MIFDIYALKDIIYIIAIGGGFVVGLIGVYWRMVYKFQSFNILVATHDDRIEELENNVQEIDRKLGRIEGNIVKIMEHLKLDPVQSIF